MTQTQIGVAAVIITPPSDLPIDLYPDRRPYLYVTNAADFEATARLTLMVSEVRSGTYSPTPGRSGWSARMLTDAEVQSLVGLGTGLAHAYRAVWLPASGAGQDIVTL